MKKLIPLILIAYLSCQNAAIGYKTTREEEGIGCSCHNSIIPLEKKLKKQKEYEQKYIEYVKKYMYNACDYYTWIINQPYEILNHYQNEEWLDKAYQDLGEIYLKEVEENPLDTPEFRIWFCFHSCYDELR